jgi:hypothetical protein
MRTHPNPRPPASDAPTGAPTRSQARFLRDLTAYSARHAGTVPFAATVVRFGPGLEEVSLMNRPTGGWRQRSYTYESLWALARAWRLVFTAFGQDEHSQFIRVEPNRSTEGGSHATQ